VKALTLLVVGMSIFGCSGRRPDNLTIVGGRLPPCPDRPNCVSSQAADTGHLIAPISYAGDPASARTRLEAAIASIPRSKVVRAGEDDLHVEFKTAIMGFVDDALFYVDDTGKKIHVRSASRVGYSDLGVNRRRIESIRKKFADLSAPTDGR